MISSSFAAFNLFFKYLTIASETEMVIPNPSSTTDVNTAIAVFILLEINFLIAPLFSSEIGSCLTIEFLKFNTIFFTKVVERWTFGISKRN